VVLKGEIEDGYYIGEKSASPNIIRVSGPKSRIEKISEVVVEVDVTNKARFFNVEPKALDEEGNIIDATRLFFSEKYIAVNLKVYKTKTVNLQIRTSGDPAEGYILTGMEFQPETVTIAAEDDILENISYLLVTEDISGANQNIEKEINLQDALRKQQEGAIIVGEDNTAVVNITIEQLETKEIEIWPNDIELRNKSDSLNVSYITKGPIKVSVRGPIKEIAELTRNTLNPYIDLTGYQTGTYVMQLYADISVNSELFDTPMIYLTLVPTY
jgi:YbbR domain-containing protein